MALLVSVDNSVLGDLIDSNIHENKKTDKVSFEQMIELDKKGIIKIGIPITAAGIEEKHAGELKRKLLREKMGKAFRFWPVTVNKNVHYDIEKKKKCLNSIMQDRKGIDSSNLLVSTIHTPYYVTTDYRFYRQFNSHSEKIRKKCGIHVFVLTPSEFIEKYKASQI